MKLIHACLAVACASAAFATTASAATLEVTSGIRGATIAAFDPIGQSFTAIDSSLLSIGFQFQGLNIGDPNTPLTLTLYSGDGFGGSVLATRSFTVPNAAVSDRTPTWFDIDLAGTSLAIGQVYTAALTATSNRAAITFGPDIMNGEPANPDRYAGGHLVSTGDPDANGYCSRTGNCDLNFRVIGTSAAAVPEPATWAMMIAGFGAVGGSLRRRSAKAALA